MKKKINNFIKERSIEITSRIGCRNMCKFCPQEKIIREYGKKSNEYEMSFDTFKICLEKVPKDVRIDFSGMAEPWLSHECTKMLLYAYNSGHKKIAVFTTGVGMTLDDIEKIKHIPFEVFCVHLIDREHNTKIIFDKSYFNLINKINTSNINNLEYMTMGRPHIKLKQLLGGKIVSKDMVSRGGNLKNFKVINITGKIKCSFPQWPERNVLLPNGDVLLCCMDYGMKYVLGNLLDISYKDLFRSSVYKNVIKRIKNTKFGDVICRHCEMAISDNSLSKTEKLVKNFVNLKNVVFSKNN